MEQDTPADWVVIAKARGPIEADILVGRLRTAGIPAWVSRESAGAAIGLTVGMLGRAEVVVPATYHKRATELLFGEDERDAQVGPLLEGPNDDGHA
jgi:hypothetical protein